MRPFFILVVGQIGHFMDTPNTLESWVSSPCTILIIFTVIAEARQSCHFRHLFIIFRTVLEKSGYVTPSRSSKWEKKYSSHPPDVHLIVLWVVKFKIAALVTAIGI